MSLAESPVHSSSSDDFTGFLERALGSGSSHSSPDEEADYESDDGSERRCLNFLSLMINVV